MMINAVAMFGNVIPLRIAAGLVYGRVISHMQAMASQIGGNRLDEAAHTPR